MEKETFKRAKKISVELERINDFIVCIEPYKKYDITDMELHIKTDYASFETFRDFGDFINKKLITFLVEEAKKRKAELEKEFEDL